MPPGRPLEGFEVRGDLTPAVQWSMYEAYIEPNLRRARAGIEHLANSSAAPRDVAAYQAGGESPDEQVRRRVEAFQ